MVADTLDALDAVEMTLNSETVTFEEARFAVAAADAVLQSHGFPTEITPYTNDCSAVILEAQKSVIGYKTVMGIWSESCPTLVQQDCPTTPFVRITLGIADARNAAGNARHDLELLR